MIFSMGVLLKPRLVYLGNLLPVARALAEWESADFTAWIIEKEDAASLGTPSLASHVSIYPVSDNTDLAKVLSHIGSVDLGVMANFGIILNRENLNYPRLGCINAHMGVLPDYPGRNPVRKALDAGEIVVGVTLHKVTEKVDGGTILDCRRVSVPENRGYADTCHRLETLCISMILRHFSCHVALGDISITTKGSSLYLDTSDPLFQWRSLSPVSPARRHPPPSLSVSV